MSLAAGNAFAKKRKITRKQVLLQEMDQVVPWAEFVALIEPHSPKPGPKGGRPPFATETMLRIYCLQQWFTLSDLAMEEALPDESTILRFRHLLEAHGIAARLFETVAALLAKRGLMLKAGTAVDATVLAAPSSTKNSTVTRDPEMHQTKKSNPVALWHDKPKAKDARRVVPRSGMRSRSAAKPHK